MDTKAGMLIVGIVAAVQAQAQTQAVRAHPGDRARPQEVAGQAGLTPQRYFECQVAARKATVQGLQERQALLARQASQQHERQAGETSRGRVMLAHYQCGYEPQALGAYAHSHAEQLKEYLQANPQMQARLEEQARKVAQMSAQMPAVAPSAKR